MTSPEEPCDKLPNNNIYNNIIYKTIDAEENSEISNSETMHKGILGILLNHQSARDLRFFGIVIGIFVFFGCHNYMQELIMSLPGFRVSTIIVTLICIRTIYSLCIIVGWYILRIFGSDRSNVLFIN